MILFFYKNKMSKKNCNFYIENKHRYCKNKAEKGSTKCYIHLLMDKLSASIDDSSKVKDFDNERDLDNILLKNLTTKDKIYVEEMIGMGSFGAVYKAILNDATRVSIKVFFGIDDESETLKLILDKAKNTKYENYFPKYFLSFKAQIGDEKYDCLVTSLHGNSLKHTYIGKKDIGYFFNFIKKIAEALHFLHDIVGIYHGDLRPDNILFRDQEDEYFNSNDQDFVLIDFGQSNYIDADVPSIIEGSYMAPETVFQQPATGKTDIWAFGCILYELYMATGDEMYAHGWNDNEETPLSKIRDDIKNNFLAKLMKQMFEINPAKRISADKILENKSLSKQSSVNQPDSDDESNDSADDDDDENYDSYGKELDEVVGDGYGYVEKIIELIRKKKLKPKYDGKDMMKFLQDSEDRLMNIKSKYYDESDAESASEDTSEDESSSDLFSSATEIVTTLKEIYIQIKNKS